MTRTVLALIALLFASKVFAFVDTATGSFTHSWIDYEGKGLDLNIKLERTYNSRSNYKGWFGFGWCSDLETTITVSESSITVHHCGAGEEIIFQKAGSLFKATRAHDGVFKKSGPSYVRSFTDGTQETYNSIGKLSEIRKNRNYITLKYNEKGTIKSLQDSGGRVVMVESNQNGYVTSIAVLPAKEDNQKQREKVAGYEYKNDDLVSATNFWGNTYTYTYDKEHNLTKAVWPGNNTVEIEYNSNDWVKSLKGTNICTESYLYKVDGSKTPTRYAADVKKVCNSGVVIERSYSYFYALDSRRLATAEVNEDGLHREYTYDNSGNVVEVIEHRAKGKVITKIERNEKGQITKVNNAFERKSYTYKVGHGKDVVTEVIIEEMASGRVLNKYSYIFRYDEDDRLIANEKDGSIKLEFRYDDEGRVAKISSKGVAIQILYQGTEEEPKAIKFGDKELPLRIYETTASEKEIAAVELYFDFLRAQQLTVPSY